MLELRWARKEDCAAVAALDKECFSHPRSEQSYTDAVDSGLSPLLAAWQDGELCGYVSGVYALDRLEILTLAVHPAYRRKGLARRLLERLFADARKQGCCVAQLEVRSQNRAALALYGSLGFEAVGLRKRYYRDPEDDAVLMDKTL